MLQCNAGGRTGGDGFAFALPSAFGDFVSFFTPAGSTSTALPPATAARVLRSMIPFRLC